MKRIITFSIMCFMSLFVFANVDSLANSPQATNYKQVLQQIEYPQVCREKGIEGTVIVLLNIGVSGEVIDYEIATSPCSDLQKAVENYIPHLTFAPAIDENGEAIEGSIALPVTFSLSI